MLRSVLPDRYLDVLVAYSLYLVLYFVSSCVVSGPHVGFTGFQLTQWLSFMSTGIVEGASLIFLYLYLSRRWNGTYAPALTTLLLGYSFAWSVPPGVLNYDPRFPLLSPVFLSDS